MQSGAFIAQANANGSYRVIRVDTEGTPKEAGLILKACYRTEESVTALLNLGNLQVLRQQVGDENKHTAETDPVTCIAYARDLGYDKRAEKARTYPNWCEFITHAKDAWHCKHIYVFYNNAWHTFALGIDTLGNAYAAPITIK